MGSPYSCSCKGKQKNGRSQPLALDELMIVNPSRFGAETLFLGDDGMASQLFLGDDGSLYHVQGFGGVGRYFLGADGTLYEVEGP